MSEMRMPTAEEKLQTSNAMSSVANLIKSGLFHGSNAKSVLDAVTWLELMAANVNSPSEKPDLKVVAEEGELNGEASN